MKILLLEDDVMLNEMISEYLSSTGHVVKSTTTGQECLETLDKEKFDLLILDINLPDVNGFTILETLHEQKRMVPTIYISALIEIEDISRAFDIGCHDYLKKPFHLKELTIRINKILKTTIVPQKHKRLSKNYSYDSETMTLLFNNEPQILPKRQIQIIELLAHNRSLVVQYDMFRNYVWNDDFIDNATIRAEVNRVKKVLKEDFIKNIRGSGYMVERPN
ncbi:response regulator transcription factor [Poseidonibacter ostreae]|jgi:two-component system, OmpR family, response regulator|uniref:Response regulator n=1 Tax=Poseidonibacter ostreae TaxID=2654171 RepID=A0A6L4WXG7_9BACT|nr:response regulator transcription factor [Poseidonibacter ostreae]KAB7885580.1 response regulator [Poseidonibacter ostreae]KAB7891021.1 response regulator [Poseidonibacter ostreae]KAB7892745.1 response regulator [Poseidonibacter ostreae]MAC83862.1 DNA-binding response regulator [Arcobacter sp.]|tara:strand:- start:4103 stop:4762 length:660 start_codon:yes stop_codon:yes gene_type:complete